MYTMCMCAQSRQLCPTLCYVVDCHPPDSSVNGNSPDKNIGVDCHCPPSEDLPNPESEPASLMFRALVGGFITTCTTCTIQSIYLHSKVKVCQSCLTLYSPMDCRVHGTLQARILEWIAFPFSRGSSQPRDRTQVSHIAGSSWATREAQIQYTVKVLVI